MLMDPADVQSALICNGFGSPLRFPEYSGDHKNAATNHVEHSDYVFDCPVIIDYERSVLSSDHVANTMASSPVIRNRPRFWLKRLTSPNRSQTKKNISRMLDKLRSQCLGMPKVLVVGGGTIGQGLEELYESPMVAVAAFDIYKSPHVHFVADAHSIPLKSDSFDGVVVQAVLEHVLEPTQVVREIYRILKPGGMVYAETPFLQHVHEGAYDFTRFTESGHRNLFCSFSLVNSGPLGGPGESLLWSIEYFIRSVFRSIRAGRIAKVLFCWLRHIDTLIPEPYRVDAATGTYFLGHKTDQPVTPADIVRHYMGAGLR